MVAIIELAPRHPRPVGGRCGRGCYGSSFPSGKGSWLHRHHAFSPSMWSRNSASIHRPIWCPAS